MLPPRGNGRSPPQGAPRGGQYGLVPVAQGLDVAHGEMCIRDSYNIEEVVKEHYDAFKGKAIISIALGWTYEKYREILPQETRVAFVDVYKRQGNAIGVTR